MKSQQIYKYGNIMPLKGTKRKLIPTKEEQALTMEMGRILASYRLKRGLTQKQVAAHLEWSLATVANLETGRQWTPIVKIASLLKIYGVSLTQFFGQLETSVNSKNEVIKNGTSQRL